ncbi:unnamed protein product [Fusarium venenatum]|uniref:Uncharacterized protein n=1 Tax=Fusarium venenatum TaxID=56646 RepID=A0A2L2SZR4_9HYPO|nr:uncharacterized protein FVRRES_00174 [Fusarium venenatum]CEI63662.1 unnamed protein product [Fusarium venenatum]
MDSVPQLRASKLNVMSCSAMLSHKSIALELIHLLPRTALSLNSVYLFGRRLAQVINTYLLVGQVYGTATEADSNFEYNITAPVEVGNFVEVYTVDWTWMALFVVSCVILLASGIASIVFAYLAIGPEILGYASSIVRDSKYVNLPAEAGKKEAFKVVKIMGQKRLKYNYIDSVAEDSQPLVGVGLKNETNSIKILTYNSGSTKTTK